MCLLEDEAAECEEEMWVVQRQLQGSHGLSSPAKLLAKPVALIQDVIELMALDIGLSLKRAADVLALFDPMLRVHTSAQVEAAADPSAVEEDYRYYPRLNRSITDFFNSHGRARMESTTPKVYHDPYSNLTATATR